MREDVMWVTYQFLTMLLVLGIMYYRLYHA